MMIEFRSLVAAGAVFLAGVAPACSSSSSDHGTVSDGTSSDAGPGSVCGVHANVADAFHPQMKTTGPAGYGVELIDATPTTPKLSASGGNSWKVKVTDASGAPVSSSATLTLNCKMPGHSHNCGGAGPTITSLGDGAFQIDHIIFQMVGYWIVNVEITDGTSSDTVPVEICVE